jgi:hypothetical protein
MVSLPVTSIFIQGRVVCKNGKAYEPEAAQPGVSLRHIFHLEVSDPSIHFLYYTAGDTCGAITVLAKMNDRCE